MRQKEEMPHGAAEIAVKICEAEVFSGLLLLLWRYYTQKAIVFALSPLRLEQACASCPPSRRGAMKGAMPLDKTLPLWDVTAMPNFLLKYPLSGKLKVL